MAETAAERIVAPPDVGRIFTSSRPVRFGDVNPLGRTRLDALSTYVQDIASDDTAQSGLGAELVWVVRRVVFVLQPAPRYLEHLQLRTWCSGIGRRWAERRVEMRGDKGAAVGTPRCCGWLWTSERTGRSPSQRPSSPAPPPAAQGREVSGPAAAPVRACRSRRRRSSDDRGRCGRRTSISWVT